MQEDSRSYKWEIARIRLRSLGYTVVQSFGFALVLWAVWAILARRIYQYYAAEYTMPGVVSTAVGMIPAVDDMTAALLLAAGAAIVWLST